MTSLIERNCLAGVVTLSESAAAKRSGTADVAALCRDAGIEVATVENINDPEAISVLQSWNADIIFVIGWSQILSQEALNCARIGTIGAHASLLPRLRGSAPVNWAIIMGESETGNSLMWLDASVDNGDLIDQRSFPITAYDTCATIYDKVAATNRDMILDALDAFERGQFPRMPQGESNEPLLARRRPSDGLIDWTADSSAVGRFIRALTRPYPGAFTNIDGQRYLVWEAVELQNATSDGGEAGRVVGAMRSPVEAACGLVVKCGRGLIGLLELESESGRILRGPELAEQPWQEQQFQ